MAINRRMVLGIVKGQDRVPTSASVGSPSSLLVGDRVMSVTQNKAAYTEQEALDRWGRHVVPPENVKDVSASFEKTISTEGKIKQLDKSHTVIDAGIFVLTWLKR